MPKEIFNNIEFDSSEEVQFYKWLLELESKGFINKITAQPESFILSQPFIRKKIIHMKRVADKIKEEVLINGHKYTCDFEVEWSKEMTEELFTRIFGIKTYFSAPKTYFEIKPSFDQNNMTRLAKINIKWVFHNTGEFVVMVIPEKLFATTFTPAGCLTTRTGQARKIKHKVVLIDEFLKTI